jgi:uroporphyrinogen III methyltransferase/synthase
MEQLETAVSGEHDLCRDVPGETVPGEGNETGASHVAGPGDGRVSLVPLGEEMESIRRTERPEPVKPGKVYLIGAGPGDPGLLTLRGRDVLARADVVIYDRLASPRLLAFASPSAERIYVGKRTGRHTVDQRGINRLIIQEAMGGKCVARLKGGDPFIFGRGGEEAQELMKAGVPFEVVPGVTSAIAVPAYAGIPLTHRSHTASVAFITGHRKCDTGDADVDWEGLAKGVGTLVFLMGMKNLPNIVGQLTRYGRRSETPVAVIRWGTTPYHRSVIGTLDTIVEKVEEAGMKPPAIIVVGDVVGLRDQINWFENRPLLGKRILVTRSREQASDLVVLLEERGAYCIELPTIAVCGPEDTGPLDQALRSLSTFDWVVFSSANAVSFFFDRLFSLGFDLRAMGGLRIAAVGSATAKGVSAFHLGVDLVPEDFRAEGLLDAFRSIGVSGRRILIPRAEKAREVLPRGLTAEGALVEVVTAYQTCTPEVDPEILKTLEREAVDCVTFTSSSTVMNFCSLLSQESRDKVLRKAAVACIGPVTADTARKSGMEVAIMPEESTIPSLVSAIESHYCKPAVP